MAAKANPLPLDIGKVRIPDTVLSRLGYFLNSLHHPIICAATARAFARKSGTAAGRVNSDDIVQAVQSVLSSSLAGLAESLKACETRHDQKKAS
jgi:hypothetical protein